MGEPGTYPAGRRDLRAGRHGRLRAARARRARARRRPRRATATEVVLAERGPGELLGDLSGIDGQPRSASVTALDEVRGLVVPLRAFRGFLMDHPRAAISLLELISRRLREAEARRALVVGRGPSTRAVPRRPAARRAGRAARARPGAGGAVPPAGRARDGAVLRLRARRQPDVDGGRGGARRARGRRGGAVLLRHGRAVRGAGAGARRRRRARGRARRLPGRARASRPTGSRRAGSRCGSCRPTPRRSSPRARARRSCGSRRPSNPALDVCDIAAVADGGARGGRAARGRQHARDAARASARSTSAPTPRCTARRSRSPGHSDLILGSRRVRDPAWAEALRAHRSQGGAIAGPFEAWLLQRSLPTLALRLARQSDERAGARARSCASARRSSDVRHPFLEDHPDHAVAARQMRHAGALVGFTLDGAERAQRFLGALELVAEATSFGGVHSTAERRARWGTDDVPDGLHPLLRRLRGRRGPARRRRAGARAELRGPPRGRAPRMLGRRRAPGVRGTAARLKVRPPCRGGVRRSGRSVRRREQHHARTNLGETLASPWSDR